MHSHFNNNDSTPNNNSNITGHSNTNLDRQGKGDKRT